MNKLVVIGNGFDIHHGLDTRYLSFGKFLKNQYSTIYDHLIELYGLPNVEDENADQLWAEFEYSLSLLDGETVLENNSHYIASPASEEFRDRDWWSFSIEIKKIVEKLTDNLFHAFKEFILQVEYPTLEDLVGNKLLLSPDNIYFSFNYTDTLERYYGVPPKNILYIHGKAAENYNVLILGHGINPEGFRDESQKTPEGLRSDDESCVGEVSDDYDYSFELGKSELSEYFTKTFKATNTIINNNQIFFNDLKSVNEVVVLGHSLSEVDLPYFSKIIDSVDSNAIWSVSYYRDKEKASHKCTLERLGIPSQNIKLIGL